MEITVAVFHGPLVLSVGDLNDIDLQTQKQDNQVQQTGQM